MSRPKHLEDFDLHAEALGLATLDQLAGSATDPAAVEDRDRETLTRRLAELPPLTERPWAADPFDDAARAAQGYPPRDPKTPSPAELARRHEEYSELIGRAHGALPSGTAAKFDDDDRATIMFEEFGSAYPELARGNRDALTDAASKVASRTKQLDWSDRAAFYRAVADELGDGASPSAAARVSPPAERSILDDLQDIQRKGGW